MINSPYKFLDYYGIDDQNIFFGREREVNILVADVVVNRLVVLFARTGTGKTSLMNAGVRPRLEERGFRTFYVRVEKDPAEAARDVLRREKLLKEANQPASLSTQLCDVVESLNQPIVLFFDQFEEFFLHLEDTTRQDFIRDISEVYRNADSGVHLLFSMREEYYFRMDEFREDIPSIFHKNSNLRLLPLDEEQARAAIIKPAAALDVEVDLSLANEIINDLKTDREGIRAPSLQIICDTLWRKEDPQDRHITLKDYADLGRAQSILDKRLSEDLEQALENKAALISLMQRLIPELITNRNTKYPRLISDLESRLNTTQGLLRDLISSLKGVEIVKEMTISGDDAVEWASDYLAERADLLQAIIKTIELRAILQEALTANPEMESKELETDQESGQPPAPRLFTEWRLPLDKFLELSKDRKSIESLQAGEIEFLLDTALFYQRDMQEWLDRVTASAQDKLEILRAKIQNKDLNLKVRRGVIILLGSFGSDGALQLLEAALDEPPLTEETIKVLIAYPGEGAEQLLARLLERDDLWEEIVSKLKGSATGRSIELLKLLLDQDAKFFRAFNAFEQLARSSDQVEHDAKEVLESAIPRLETFLTQDEKRLESCSALGRLARFESSIGDKAIAVLGPAVGTLNKGLKQDAKFFDTLRVLEQLISVREPIAGNAEKALEAAIPLLDAKLKNGSTADLATRTLKRLAKIQKPFGKLAQECLETMEKGTQKPPDEFDTENGNRPTLSESIVQPLETGIRETTPKTDAPPPIGEPRPSQTYDSGSGLRRRSSQVSSADLFTETDRMEELMRSILRGKTVPVISNSLRIDQIFSDEQALAKRLSETIYVKDEDLTISEQLTQQWAKFIEYPMSDSHNLAQVTQYYQVQQKESLLAKSKYLSFLGAYLLDIAAEDVGYQELVQQLRMRQRSEDFMFSKIVGELDYPRLPSAFEDPLRLLARLPLQIYITTSYHNFMEVALLREGKQPRTQLCLWSGGRANIKPEHQPDPTFEPSEVSPLVYHLYGLEDYPQTLVLSEDDYLNFLFAIAQDINTQNPVVPLIVRQVLAESRLMFLGYHLRDWDFRILLRLMAQYRGTGYASRGLLIHTRPAMTTNAEQSLRYLSQYFDQKQFDVQWNTPERFIQDLWNRWNSFRKGEA